MRRRNLAIPDPIGRPGVRSRARSIGPAATFIATVLAAFIALAFATIALPRDFVLPALATLYFAMAALVALVAWCAHRSANHDALTYWDVAGALTLFGVCAAAMLDPEQLVRLVEGTYRPK